MNSSGCDVLPATSTECLRTQRTWGRWRGQRTLRLPLFALRQSCSERSIRSSLLSFCIKLMQLELLDPIGINKPHARGGSTHWEIELRPVGSEFSEYVFELANPISCESRRTSRPTFLRLSFLNEAVATIGSDPDLPSATRVSTRMDSPGARFTKVAGIDAFP